MKKFTKSILIILIIFLFGTNIALIVSFQLHKSNDIVKVNPKIKVPDSQMGRFFNNELSLDSKQQDMFREFRRKYNRSANKTIIEMNSIRNKMALELNSVKPDRKKLNNLSDQLGEKHKELKGYTFDYYFRLQSVLNENQQKKMVEIFQAMLTDSGDAVSSGQGRGRNQRMP